MIAISSKVKMIPMVTSMVNQLHRGATTSSMASPPSTTALPHWLQTTALSFNSFPQ